MANYVLFTVYDPETGAVLRSGSCPDTDLNIQHDPDTEAILPDVAADGRVHVVDVDSGQVVDAPSNHTSMRRGSSPTPQPATESDPVSDLIARVAALEAEMQSVKAKLGL